MSVIEMENKKAFRQKTMKNEKGIGIMLPDEMIARLNIQPGDQFDITENERGEIVLKRVPLLRNVRSEVMEALTEVMEEYDDVLRTLKDK